jgi:DNA-binding transcriptional LysR family regulator
MSQEQSKKAIDSAALRALVAVADDGSFRRAGERLGYTQSAISHQIASLERHLSATLFHRPGGRAAVTLTAAGEVAYHHARRVLAAFSDLDVEVRATQRGERETLHIGVFQTAAAELVPPALRALGERHPGVEVTLVEAERGDEVGDALTRGRLDLAFVLNPEPLDTIEAIPLRADPWVILTWRGSPLAGAQRPSLDLLDGVQVVAWSQHWQSQVELEELWRRRGIAPRVVYRTDDNVALQRLVAAGLGHACVGRLVAQRPVEPSLTWLAPREVLPARTIALCHARGRRLSDAARALIEIARSQSAAVPPRPA